MSEVESVEHDPLLLKAINRLDILERAVASAAVRDLASFVEPLLSDPAGRIAPTDASEAAEIARRVVEALATLHGSAGIHHRDLKPGNLVLASEQQKAIVSDFGLVRTENAVESLANEIIELERVSPPPDPADILRDARWYQEEQDRGALKPYQGTNVVVLNGAIVGAGENSLELQLDLARKFNVHPQRFIIEYVHPPGQRFFPR